MQGASFEDIRWRGKDSKAESGRDVDIDGESEISTHQALRITLHWSENPIRMLDYVFDRIDSPAVPLLRRLRVRSFASERDAGWVRARRQLLRAEEDADALTYEIQRANESNSTLATISFEGLLPYATTDDTKSVWISEARTQILSLRGQIQWLRAKRQAPLRYTVVPSNPRHRLLDDGSDAALLLASRPALLSAVSSWYEQMVERRLILQEVSSAAFRTQLQHLKTGQEVDLLDSGEGMNQVLSVLCALEAARTKHSHAPRILALEEPESHLHPRLQRGLVDRLVAIASEPAPPRIILETHSEYLLLGVQLAIARGSLAPENVAVYWVRQDSDGRSVAELSTFDEKAFPEGFWPASVFAEDTELAREVVRARKERKT